MTNKDLKEKLDSAKTHSEIKRILESINADIVKAAKAQMQFEEQWIDNDATLTEKREKRIQTVVEY